MNYDYELGRETEGNINIDAITEINKDTGWRMKMVINLLAIWMN